MHSLDGRMRPSTLNLRRKLQYSWSVDSRMTQQDKAQHFAAMHERDGCILMPNAWDAGSARMLEAAGFEAVLTTSAGIAFSLGLPDYGVASGAPRMTREAMLARVAEIAAAVDVPVSADLEDGYGATPADVAQTISLANRCWCRRREPGGCERRLVGAVSGRMRG